VNSQVFWDQWSADLRIMFPLFCARFLSPYSTEERKADFLKAIKKPYFSGYRGGTIPSLQDVSQELISDLADPAWNPWWWEMKGFENWPRNYFLERTLPYLWSPVSRSFCKIFWNGTNSFMLRLKMSCLFSKAVETLECMKWVRPDSQKNPTN